MPGAKPTESAADWVRAPGLQALTQPRSPNPSKSVHMVAPNPITRLRSLFRRWYAFVSGDAWFPHIPLALAIAGGGLLLLHLNCSGQWPRYFEAVKQGNFNLPPALLPPLLIGGGMVIMAGGLLSRSRLAWTMALLLTLTGVASLVLGRHTSGHLLLGYFTLMSV